MKRVMDVKVWKSGHSLVVTLTKKIIKRFKIKAGDTVEITIEKDTKEKNK